MSDVQKRDASLDSLLAKGPITRLHMDGDRIVLEVVHGGNLSSTTTLEVGSLLTVLRLLRHEPATPDELEAAITEIEDRLMPVIRLLPAHRCLVTSSPAVCNIAKHAAPNSSRQTHLDVATIELLFNRLADLAHGAPPARVGIPADRHFAAVLLGLRELLHHARFESAILIR
ncbi:MAG: hypothetical protein WBX11_12035 [Thiobacillaceae bacterium]